MAVPDFRGSGDAQNLMGAFNQTLWDDLSGLRAVQDGRPRPCTRSRRRSSPRTSASRRRRSRRPRARGRREPPQPTTGNGLWLRDWSSPPVSANYLAFGYTAAQNDVLVLFGWLFNVTRENVSAAQVIGKRYFGSLDENGARKVAHEFAADILAQFGGKRSARRKIYFVSDRSGHKEIWSMDADGAQPEADHALQLDQHPAGGFAGRRQDRIY